MSSNPIYVEGYQASDVFVSLDEAFKAFTDQKRTDYVKRINGVFQITIIGKGGKSETWTLYMKNNDAKVCKIELGKAVPKADVTLQMPDQVFMDIKDGKLNGQKAFMTQRLQVKGNVMLALKLDAVLKEAGSSLKSKL